MVGQARSPSSETGSSQVTERGLDVLMAFLESDADMGVTEISKQLGIEKGRVHRFLAALKSRGLVVADKRTRRYKLGPRVLELAGHLLRQVDFATVVKPYLRELRDATDETAGVAIRVGDARVNLAQCESRHEIRRSLPIGQPFPVHLGAAGRVLLAFSNDDIDLPDALESVTSQTITDPERLVKELALVRRRGYATSLGDRVKGSRSIAVPVWTWQGNIMALLVSGPHDRFGSKSAAAIIPQLRMVASRCTQDLGGTDWASKQRLSS